MRHRDRDEVDIAEGAAREQEVRVKCVSDEHGFRSLENSWKKLYKGCHDVTPFNSWEWLYSWWITYRKDKRLRILLFYEKETQGLIGVFPLYLTHEWVCGMRSQVLRFVGDGSYDSDYLNVVVEPAFRIAVIRGLQDWLQERTDWDAMVLRHLPPSCTLPRVFFACTGLNRKLLTRIEAERCGVVYLPQSFDDFLRKLRPRFRTKVRSLLRRFDNDESLIFEVDCPTSRLRSYLRSLFRLHQRRWQDAGMQGVFASKEKKLFYARFVTRFARNGWLRLYSLRCGSQFVAHQLCFAEAGVTYLLQEGFDSSSASASYGQMLRALVFRNLIEHGEKAYDFLGGFSRHKADWDAQQCEMPTLIVARASARGLVYFKYPGLRESAARNVKRLVSPVASFVRR